jgi:hypothetical protein
MNACSPRSFRTAYTHHPSWFGGAEEARKATVELAMCSADNMRMSVGEIVVDERAPDFWVVTIQYVDLR